MFIVTDGKHCDAISEFCYISKSKNAMKLDPHYVFTFLCFVCTQLEKNVIGHPSFKKRVRAKKRKWRQRACIFTSEISSNKAGIHWRVVFLFGSLLGFFFIMLLNAYLLTFFLLNKFLFCPEN